MCWYVTLQEEGLAIKEEPHTNRVPRSQRGGEVVEPLVQLLPLVRDVVSRLAQLSFAGVTRSMACNTRWAFLDSLSRDSLAAAWC